MPKKHDLDDYHGYSVRVSIRSGRYLLITGRSPRLRVIVREKTEGPNPNEFGFEVYQYTESEKHVWDVKPNLISPLGKSNYREYEIVDPQNVPRDWKYEIRIKLINPPNEIGDPRAIYDGVAIHYDVHRYTLMVELGVGAIIVLCGCVLTTLATQVCGFLFGGR